MEAIPKNTVPQVFDAGVKSLVKAIRNFIRIVKLNMFFSNNLWNNLTVDIHIIGSH